jgi:WD40 repeat protein
MSKTAPIFLLLLLCPFFTGASTASSLKPCADSLAGLTSFRNVESRFSKDGIIDSRNDKRHLWRGGYLFFTFSRSGGTLDGIRRIDFTTNPPRSREFIIPRNWLLEEVVDGNFTTTFFDPDLGRTVEVPRAFGISDFDVSEDGDVVGMGVGGTTLLAFRFSTSELIASALTDLPIDTVQVSSDGSRLLGGTGDTFHYPDGGKVHMLSLKDKSSGVFAVQNPSVRHYNRAGPLALDRKGEVGLFALADAVELRRLDTFELLYRRKRAKEHNDIALRVDSESQQAAVVYEVNGGVSRVDIIHLNSVGKRSSLLDRWLNPAVITWWVQGLFQSRIEFVPNSSLLMISGFERVHFLDTRTGRIVLSLTTDTVRSHGLSPDGRWFFLANRLYVDARRNRLFRIEAGRLSEQDFPLNTALSSFAFSEDSRTLAFDTSLKGSSILWRFNLESHSIEEKSLVLRGGQSESLKLLGDRVVVIRDRYLWQQDDDLVQTWVPTQAGAN